jgi:hypothetical protein
MFQVLDDHYQLDTRDDEDNDLWGSWDSLYDENDEPRPGRQICRLCGEDPVVIYPETV